MKSGPLAPVLRSLEVAQGVEVAKLRNEQKSAYRNRTHALSVSDNLETLFLTSQLPNYGPGNSH
jgi:hypothetical protein